MQIRKIPLDSLIPGTAIIYKKFKPGDAEFERIKNSIEDYGVLEPIIVNSEMRILNGTKRWYVLRHLGYPDADCVVVTIDKPAEKDLCACLNKTTPCQTAPPSKVLELFNLDFDMCCDQPVSDPIAPPTCVCEDDCDIPLPETPVTKAGDLWLLGKHRLLCGDSSHPHTLTNLADGVFVDLVMLDPPGDVPSPHDFLAGIAQKLVRVMASNARIFAFPNDNIKCAIRDALLSAGLRLSGVCLKLKWDDDQSRWKYEPVLFSWSKDGRQVRHPGNKVAKAWFLDDWRKSEVHYDMRPITLCAYPIYNCCEPETVVLDPFGGTGSTLIAAHQAGRKCLTAEFDPAYCDVILKRYIRQVGGNDDIYLIRDGMKYKYADIMGSCD